MPTSPNRVALQRVDWCAVLPVLRLAGAFRLALQPGKLVVALLAVVLLHGCGVLMDAVWGGAASDGLVEPGAYESFMLDQGAAFGQLVDSAWSLDLGLARSEAGVADALYRMCIASPAAVFDHHPWFAVVFGLVALLVTALASGVICRMTAAQVCLGESIALPRAARFVAARAPWYVITPMLPTLLILAVGGVLMLAGLVLFNIPGLDVVGALFYGVLLLLGFVVALVTVLLLFALVLMAPALSVEGTDGFDAIARSFNYILFKPWQFAGYLLASVGYLAAVYLFVAVLAGLTLSATHGFVGVGAFRGLDPDAVHDLTRFEAIASPAPTDAFGEPINLPDHSATLEPSAWIVARWHALLAGIVAAVMFSVVCCLQTQVYVLMRRAVDGTPIDDCAADDEEDPWSTPQDLSDPATDGPSVARPEDATGPTQPDPSEQ